MSGYDKINNMSGYNYSAGEYMSTAHGPENPGTNPRYVAPQKRELIFGAMPPIERPESAMSNTSFASQAFGGVSLNDLMGHDSEQSAPRESGNLGAGLSAGYGGQQRSFSGPYGQTAPMGAGQASRQRGYSEMAPSTAGGFGAPGGYANGPGAQRGGFGSFGGMRPQGNYTFGNTQSQAPSVLRQNQGGLPNFGAVGSAVPRPAYPAMPTNVSSPDSAYDSVRGGGNRQAYDLAQLIRSGGADPGDDDSNDPLTGRGSGRGRGKPQHVSQHVTAPTVTMPQHRPTQSMANAELDPSYKSAMVVSRESNTKGSAAAFLAVEPQPYPEYFQHLQRGIKPTIEEFFVTMPAIEACGVAVVSNAGVIRIRNIPFTTPRSEITAFVGRNAQIVSMPAGAPYFAVHIIMERHTGKTMDAFIEFARGAEAQYVVSQFNKRILAGRHPRLGDRHVEVEISTQEDLMTEMFPRAKNVHWEGGTPRVLANKEMYYEGVPSAGFTGFLENEEVVMVIKHAETPHRSPFAQRAIIRVYESHISTLHKYPWFAHECVNMTERRLLFDATMSLAKSLIIHLRKVQSQSQANQQTDVTKPTAATLQEFTVATLTCPGFSEQQKFSYIQQLVHGGFGTMASSRGMNLKFGGVSDLAAHWPFQVLARDPGSQEDVVLYFASLLREATANGKQLSLIDQHRMRASGGNMQGPFGNIHFDYGTARTLCEVAEVELRTIEMLLSRVLPRSRANSDA